MKISELIETSPKRWSYATWMNIRAGFFYVETPKAACTKIKKCLQEISGFPIPDNLEDLHYRRNQNSFVGNIFSCANIDTKLKSQGIFKFCFVRDPVDRVISAYNDKIQSSPGAFWEKYRRDIRLSLNIPNDSEISLIDFSKYIASLPNSHRDIHWRSQTSLLRPEVFHYDFIGKVENFDRDFSHVLKSLSVQNPEKYLTGKENISRQSNLKEPIVEECSQIISKAYAEDYRNFGY